MLEELLARARQEEEAVRDTVFQEEVLTDADCSGLEFRSVGFIRCRFLRCDFSRAAFWDAAFTGCDFSNCALAGTYWLRCSLTDCKGDGADLSGSRLRESALSGTSLRYTNCSRSLWADCGLSRCTFREGFWREARLKKLRLEAVDFTGVDFFHTPLEGVDLTTCAIDGLLVSDSYRELRGAVIQAAQADAVARLLGMKVL